MHWVLHLDALHDFIGLVILRAPDRFPTRDFLPDDEQLNLDRAFKELRSGLDFVAVSPSDPTFHDRLRTALDESLEAYRTGDRREGAHRLQDFQNMIFGSSDRPS
jgi:hypothetical protein